MSKRTGHETIWESEVLLLVEAYLRKRGNMSKKERVTRLDVRRPSGAWGPNSRGYYNVEIDNEILNGPTRLPNGDPS